MNKLQELIQRKATVLADIETISKAVETEKRNFDAKEIETIEQRKKEIADLNQRIEVEKLLEDNKIENARSFFENKLSKDEQRAFKDFNLGKALDDLANGRAFSGIEKEMVEEGLNSIRGFGSYSGLVLPESYVRTFVKSGNNLGVTGQGTGINVATEDLLFPYLQPTIYPLVTGNFDLPYSDSYYATFATENTDKSDDTFAPAKVTLTSELLPYNIGFSRQSLAQITAANQNAFMQLWIDALDRGEEKKAFDLISALAAMGAAYSGTSKTLNFSGITAMEANIPFVSAYVTSRKLMGNLKGRDKLVAGTSGRFIWDDNNLVNGKPAFSTSLLGDTYAIAGDFKKGLAIGRWGGLIILRDEFTSKKKGNIEIQVSRLVDIKVANPKCFSVVKNAI